MVKYVNLGEVFDLDIDSKNITIGEIVGTKEKHPKNKMVTIKNFYKNPDAVKEYAESCPYTNSKILITFAPVLRAVAANSGVLAKYIPTLAQAIFGDDRTFHCSTNGGMTDVAYFSWYSPESIVYHKYSEPHLDGSDYQRKSPNQTSNLIAGVVFLEPEGTFGTEIMKILSLLECVPQ